MLTTQDPTKRGEILHVIHNLQVLGNTLSKWFNKTSMEVNPGKYELAVTPVN